VLVRVVQTVVTFALIGFVLRRVARITARRRGRAVPSGEGFVLAYPRWVSGLGGVTMLGFGAVAVIAARADSGGPVAGAVFAVMALLGLVLVVSARADVFVIDAAGIERRRFGRPRSLAWDDPVRLTWSRQGGINLIGRSGHRLPVAQMLDGFGVLCDELLRRAPTDLEVEPDAAACVVFGSTLEPAVVQRLYAPWFEREASAAVGRPGVVGPDGPAIDAGRMFASRMLERHGSFVPFVSQVTASGAVRILHDDAGTGTGGGTAFRLEDGAVVLDDGNRTWREPIRGGR
jgi:hypothetical protein